MTRHFFFLSLSLLSAAAAASASAPAQQVWITLTGKAGEMAVSWVTSSAAAANEIVLFGVEPDSLTLSATGTSAVLTTEMDTPIRIHVAVLTVLPDNATVYYDAGAAGRTLSFTSSPARPGGFEYAIFGDLGLADDYSLDALLAEAAANAFDAVIFSGDFVRDWLTRPAPHLMALRQTPVPNLRCSPRSPPQAYDLESAGGATGNAFMEGLSPIISKVPLLPVAGNHETLSDNSFGHYKARFAAARALGENSGNAGEDANRWYSFNEGLVHWISVDTEIYSYGTAAQIAAQLAWLDADVAAIDRSATPWVLAQGHKGYWESPKTDWQELGLDAALARANVSAFFCGHTHNYQRSRAFVNEAASDNAKACYSAGPPAVYTDCQGTVGILAGSPGMSQGIGTRKLPKDVALVDIQAWGYGKLTVVNATHLRWRWFETATAKGPLPWGQSVNSDEAWIVRSSS